MRYHPVFHKKMMHNGVDLAANYEVVYSMFPGRVVQVGNDKRSGNFVIVKTDCYTVSYCHLSKVFVRQGDFVEAGTPICRSGNTGTSTGPHLHLTTKKDGKAINPAILLEYISQVKVL
jgi:murein DD-endopeptidase MepM/ murein hydrolase activator NlpD